MTKLIILSALSLTSMSRALYCVSDPMQEIIDKDIEYIKTVEVAGSFEDIEEFVYVDGRVVSKYFEIGGMLKQIYSEKVTYDVNGRIDNIQKESKIASVPSSLERTEAKFIYTGEGILIEVKERDEPTGQIHSIKCLREGNHLIEKYPNGYSRFMTPYFAYSLGKENLVERIEYKYPQNNDIETKKLFYKNGIIEKVIMEERNETIGISVVTSLYENGRIASKTEQNYDSPSKLRFQKNTVFEYIFDKRGNWIERREFDVFDNVKEFKYSVKRQIKYKEP